MNKDKDIKDSLKNPDKCEFCDNPTYDTLEIVSESADSYFKEMMELRKTVETLHYHVKDSYIPLDRVPTLLKLWRGGMGTREAAKVIGLSAATLNRIENGNTMSAVNYIKIITGIRNNQ